MTDASDEAQEWHELDQASVRASIREILRRDMPDDYGDRIPALRQLLSIVREEIATAIDQNVNRFVEHHPRDSAKDARRLVDTLERDLSSLGLAIKHPDTGAPARLSVAATPPHNRDQTWLQLEPLDATRSAVAAARLPNTIDYKLTVIPEPPRIRTADRPANRSR